MIRSLLTAITILAAILLILATQVHAGTPVLLAHQGRLLGSDDTPVDGPTDLEFRIFGTPTGGVAVWSEIHLDVDVQNGLFSVTLGSTSPLSEDMLAVMSSSPMERYLEVVVQGTPITPRVRLVSAPYAVAASRVSGDIETRDGALSIIENGTERATIEVLGSVTYMGTWDTVHNNKSLVYAGDDSAGIVIEDNQGKLVSLSSNVGINEPIPDTKLHLGDINRDGIPDVVIASNVDGRKISFENEGNPLVISDNDDSTFLALGHNPLNRPAYANFVCQLTESRVQLKSKFEDGDIPNQEDRVASISTDSAKAEIFLGTDLNEDGEPDLFTKKYVDDVATAMSVTTHGTGNHNNEANIAATLNGNVVIGAVVHTDDSGTPLNSSTITVDDNQASNRVSGGKGFYYVVINAGSDPGDGASHVVAADPDLNGINNGQVWEKVDNTGAISSVGMDIDQDGTADVGTETRALLPKSVIKSFFQSLNTPTETQFEVVADSSGTVASLSIDVDGDGDNEGSGGMQLIKDRSELKQEFENGDIPTQDNVLQASCDANGSSFGMRTPTPLLTWGTGLAFHVDSNGPNLSMDHDSLPTFIVESSPSSTEMRLQKAIADGDTKLRMSAGQSDCVMQIGDLNSDGYMELTTSSSTSGLTPQSSTFRMGRPAVNTALLSTDASSSSMTLAHASSGPGDKPTSVQFGNLIDSYVHLVEDGLTAYSVNSSTGIEMRSGTNTVSCTIDRNGNGYLSTKLGIGKTPVEKIDVDGGAYCDGTNWVNASDINSKENFRKVDGEELLEKIAELEITEWNYKGDANATHIGPTAQDFKKTFGVGKDEKSISTIDPSGIALAAIKELYAQLKKKDSQIENLQKQLTEVKKELKKK